MYNIWASASAVCAFAIVAFLAERFALPDPARRGLRMALALFAGFLIEPPDSLLLGAGRELSLPMPIERAGAAAWVYLLAASHGAMARRAGPALALCAIGLAGLGVSALIAGAPIAALLAFALAALSVAAAAMDVGARKFAAVSGEALGAGAACASLFVLSEAETSPFAPLMLFLPVLVDALTSKARSGPFVFELGRRAGISRAHVGWAYWFAAAQCALVAIVASEAGRRAAAIDLANMDPLSARLTFAASLAPVIAFLVLALLLFRVSSAVRAFASVRGDV